MLCAALGFGCIEDVELAMVPDAARPLDAVTADVVSKDREPGDSVTPVDRGPVDVSPSDAADVTDASDAPTDLRDAPDDAVDDRPATSTLTVQAVLISQQESEFTSEWHSDLEVTVTRGATAPTGVQVTWTSPLGSVLLASTEGRYRATREGYVAWSEITVGATGERPVSQRWTSPAMHVITSPRAGETHAALTPLDVVWAPGGAMEAQVTVPALLSATADTGRATIPGTYFPRELREVDVRIRRRSAVSLTSFAAGSTARTDIVAASSVIVPLTP